MQIRLVVEGIQGEPALQHFDDPVAFEAAYLRLCAQVRTTGPGAVRAPRTAITDPAYFRLDQHWSPAGREHEPERLGLWTPEAQGYHAPSEFQLRGAAQVLGESGEGMARRLGISGRQWRYYLSGEREIPFAEWRCIRLWLGDC